ncbi:hypothetical protein BJ508DRAFT_381026 [Ascobolus immersus RN42]|uniref:Uncharacterized protein n=1 Tax=Ascobolus immersus RN42 TaxID=1160509 RepID=A0A3N4HN39_ASCIM|nr:hypothetical protein BJ508DRAFT_381026 [Ascobolus immersus RN42]
MRLRLVLFGATALLGWAGNVSAIGESWLPIPVFSDPVGDARTEAGGWFPFPKLSDPAGDAEKGRVAEPRSWLPIPVYSDPYGDQRRETAKAAKAEEAERRNSLAPPPGHIEGEFIPGQFLVFFEPFTPTNKRVFCSPWHKITFEAETLMKEVFERFYKNMNRLDIPYESLRNMTCVGHHNHMFTHFRLPQPQTAEESAGLLASLKRLKKVPGVKQMQNAEYVDLYERSGSPWFDAFLDYLNETVPRALKLYIYQFSPRGLENSRRYYYGRGRGNYRRTSPNGAEADEDVPEPVFLIPEERRVTYPEDYEAEDDNPVDENMNPRSGFHAYDIPARDTPPHDIPTQDTTPQDIPAPPNTPWNRSPSHDSPLILSPPHDVIPSHDDLPPQDIPSQDIPSHDDNPSDDSPPPGTPSEKSDAPTHVTPSWENMPSFYDYFEDHGTDSSDWLERGNAAILAKEAYIRSIPLVPDPEFDAPSSFFEENIRFRKPKVTVPEPEDPEKEVNPEDGQGAGNDGVQAGRTPGSSIEWKGSDDGAAQAGSPHSSIEWKGDDDGAVDDGAVQAGSTSSSLEWKGGDDLEEKDDDEIYPSDSMSNYG